MKKKIVIFLGGVIVLLITISAYFILNQNKIKNDEDSLKKEQKISVEIKAERERKIREAKEQVKILAENQRKGQMKQEEILREYQKKILEEKDKGKRVELIKEMVSNVGKYGIDASAIPILEETRERLSESDEKKIVFEKVKSIMKNRDMVSELSEYEKQQ